MRLSLTAAALAALALSACNKTDTAPRPEHSDVATAMPDAAATPGAVGPATAAPHADPGPATTLSDVHPQPGGQPPAGATGAPAAPPQTRPQ